MIDRAEAAAPPSGAAASAIGVIGRLSPEKGVDRALEVLAMVARRRPDARLVIAGEGPEEETLRRQAQALGVAQSVSWLGYREDLGDVYRQLAVVLIPSRSEGLPNVALEAMASGVPVVASAVGGLAEIITDGENGFLLGPDDTEGLAGRIAELLEHPDLRASVSRRGIEDVSARFSLGARLRALAGIYEAGAPVRIAFLSVRPPYPPNTGGRIRTFHLLKELSREHDVTLLTATEGQGDRAALDALRQVMPRLRARSVDVEPESRWGRMARAARNPIDPLPFTWAKYRQPRLTALVGEALAGDDHDVVHCDHVQVAHALEGLQHPASRS